MRVLIVVITHAPLATALKEVVLHVFPHVDTMLVYDIPPDVQPEAMQAQIIADIKQKQDSAEQGVLVFSDLIGATPANIATRIVNTLNLVSPSFSTLSDEEKMSETKVVERSIFFGGVNVCMLLNAVRYIDLPIETLKIKILEGGQKGMQSVDCSCIAN